MDWRDKFIGGRGHYAVHASTKKNKCRNYTIVWVTVINDEAVATELYAA